MKPPRKRVPGARKKASYGYFSSDGGAYVVTTVDTPRPWCNLLGNEQVASTFSQCGQGVMFYVSSGYEQVTNWQELQYYPSKPSRGRLVFLKDRDTGEYWTANPQPGEEKDYLDFHCIMEPFVSTIHVLRRGIEFSMRAFIPADENVEIWTLQFTNRGNERRRLSIYPVVEFPTRRIHWFFSASFRKALNAIYFRDINYGNNPTGAFFWLDKRMKVHSHETSMTRFYGPLNFRLKPQGIEKGLSCRDSANEWAVGVMETRVTLEPGSSVSFNVMVGRAPLETDMRRIIRKYSDPSRVERALEKVKGNWANTKEKILTSLPDTILQHGLNCWTKYCIDVSMRFQQGSKVGYRDILQFCRAYMPLNPDKCRKKILEALGFQYAEGRAVRGYNRLIGTVDERDARDGVSWLADTLEAYLKETGDLDILDEEVPYYDKGRGTVWEHLLRAAEFLYTHRGRHKMCLVGGGDWNDALNIGGGKGRGESVWLSMATCRTLRITAAIAERIGEKQIARKLLRWRKQLVKDINAHAWDGGWYVYGFTDDGEPVGSSANKEGKIFANVQTWALMEDIVPPERKDTLLKNMEKYLCTDVGILVLHPAYTEYDEKLGRISAMSPGTYENGSAYVHGTAFLIAAYLACGMPEEALKYWHIAHPTNKLNPHSGCEHFGCTTFYCGPASPDFGFSENSWFTGSTAWLFFQAVENLLGVKADYDGLRIDPCIPPQWKRYTVIRRFRGATYRIRVNNPDGVKGGIKEVKYDGEVLRDNLIPTAEGGTHTVEVLLG